ncbi:hypothetical protein, partial [Streptomyces sp. SID3343]|uniref:hypothetical protein n=1 Tax=Streptomyces sp. SID3343 TaxID=2690260 RepID=UPI001F24983C
MTDSFLNAFKRADGQDCRPVFEHVQVSLPQRRNGGAECEKPADRLAEGSERVDGRAGAVGGSTGGRATGGRATGG